jgi:7,8-dihydropterin-6-yl-methyl-4-(beta-D-ribofuranosyl)aminobenzene 5'-phosphate synthase
MALYDIAAGRLRLMEERSLSGRVVLLAFCIGLLMATAACLPISDTGLAPTPVLPLREEELPENMSLTIVYDNNLYDPRLEIQWGFGCWIEYGDKVVLFDTGGDGGVLLSNMGQLGLDPQDIDIVVLSHIHGDHIGGLEALLSTGVRPEVYVPVTFPTNYKNQLRQWVTVHEVDGPECILPGVYSTGKMGVNIPEQGLMLRTQHGVVVVTGCAHPGIALMVQQAKDVMQDDIRLVLGGFHLGGATANRVHEICETFRGLGVLKVAPCHCTGEQAMQMFASQFGDDYLRVGVGWSLDLS